MNNVEVSLMMPFKDRVWRNQREREWIETLRFQPSDLPDYLPQRDWQGDRNRARVVIAITTTEETKDKDREIMHRVLAEIAEKYDGKIKGYSTWMNRDMPNGMEDTLLHDIEYSVYDPSDDEHSHASAFIDEVKALNPSGLSSTVWKVKNGTIFECWHNGFGE